jgi:hypothetical protein
MKKLTLLSLFCCFLVYYTGYSQTYYVISVQKDIFVGGNLLKAKDKISADAVLKFGSNGASAVIFTPSDGKFILSAHNVEENSKGELVAKLSDVRMHPMDFYFLNTRASGEITAEDFGESLYDNPAESEVITVYFVDKEPTFALPIPQNLLRKDAYFYLKGQTNTILLPINDGKLIFKQTMQDTASKNVDLMNTKQLFDFFYHTNNPSVDHPIGQVKFAVF